MAGGGAPRETGVNQRTRFKDRVRQWREQAILQAVGELLVSEGCLSLTMDDVAKQVGIAKGSLYLHTTARGELVDQVLSQWAEDVSTAPGDIAKGQEWAEVCDALFTPVERGATMRPAIPCCLRLAPCPHGWMRRWDEMARARHLAGDGEEAKVLGEAIQALAAMDSVRSMLEEGRIDDAAQVIQRFIAGYVRGLTKAKAV